MRDLTTQRIARRPTRSARLSAGDMLFCYGTLQFDAVLHALLSRVPERHPDSAPGWRPAALAGRQYPGLVAAADAVAPGLLLTEWGIFDAFEDTLYDLREVTLASGRRAWAYIRTEDEARPHDGDAALFETEHLAQYATRCGRIDQPWLRAGCRITAPPAPVRRAGPRERPRPPTADDSRENPPHEGLPTSPSLLVVRSGIGAFFDSSRIISRAGQGVRNRPPGCCGTLGTLCRGGNSACWPRPHVRWAPWRGRTRSP